MSEVSAPCAALVGAVAAVGPEQRDAGRAGVEAARMRSDDGLVDPPVPAFVDRAEPVDEVVVADVVPAVAPDVVELDPLHDRRCLRLRVRVAAGRVVNDSRSGSGERRTVARAGCSRPRPTPSAGQWWAPRWPPAAAAAPASAGSTRGRREHGRHARFASPRCDRRRRPTRDCRDASRHDRAPRQSPELGASSSSGAAGRQAVHVPESERVRKSTWPGPRQCTPTSVNLVPSPAVAMLRLGPRASSTAVTEACVRRGGRGRCADEGEWEENDEETAHDDQGGSGAVRAQAGEPCVDAILTACVTPLSRGLRCSRRSSAW